MRHDDPQAIGAENPQARESNGLASDLLFQFVAGGANLAKSRRDGAPAPQRKCLQTLVSPTPSETLRRSNRCQQRAQCNTPECPTHYRPQGSIRAALLRVWSFAAAFTEPAG